MTTRRLLALVAIVLLALGGFRWGAGDQATAGVLARSAIVIGALWLVYPDLQGADPKRILLVLVLVGFALTRPAVLIWLVPVWLAWAWFRHRHR